MSFPQFPNGDFEEKISLRENVEGEFQYDVNIGWELHQVSYDKVKSGISISKRCLGAVQCNNKECGKIVRPASSNKRIEVQIAGPCTFCKVHSLEHVTCSVRVNFKICGQLGHFKHKGTHTHGIFEALHDTMEVLDKVEERVLECPSETAYALKIGTSIVRPQQPARPMRLISKALHRHGKIKRYRRNYLTKAGKLPYTRPSLERAAEELGELKDDFPGYFRSVDVMPSQFCIAFSVPGIAARANFHKHPILTDVTYDCFPKGYYLCSTNVFFEELGKFGVIFQAVIDGLSAEHFKAYFLAFFRTFGAVIGNMDKEIDINFSGLVMDFSQAQRAGMFLAFKEAFPQSTIDPSTLLRGCYHHYQQSVQRLVSNHAIVPVESKDVILDLTSLMYNARSEQSFNRAVEQLRDEFPTCERWIQWWTKDEIAAMIFRSKDALKKELQESNCRTTNGIEALHHDLYRIIERKKPIIFTLRQMFSYLQSIEVDFECFDNGVKVKDAAKKSYKPKKQRYVSDGCAPDTTLSLLGSAGRKNKNCDQETTLEGKKNDLPKDGTGGKTGNKKGERSSQMKEKKSKKDDGMCEDDGQVKEEEGETRRERLARLREEKTRQVREAYKQNKMKRRKEAEEREAKRLKAQDEDEDMREDALELVPQELDLSPIPDYILQQYQISQQDFAGLYCPRDDGNCGWRAVSAVLFDKEDRYYVVKEGMVATLEREKDFFKHIYDDDQFKRLFNKLTQPEGTVSFQFWFDTIDCPTLLAHTCRRPVIMLAGPYSATYLPFQERDTMVDSHVVENDPIVLLGYL
ncbi:hypothetical protein INT45_011161 [Circinella minor]|uniref:OTU domain-containing protein n=1 Tax=Circinella minor TaxID=1195481 RepID=A0A8H7RUS0_9FUNG|nr:hypothetical protein INT45_011161 [Circinella minor]